MSDLERQIIDFVNRRNYRPIKPRTLAKRLGLPKNEAPQVRRAVKRLVRLGVLAYAESHRVKPGKELDAAARTSADSATPPSPRDEATDSQADSSGDSQEAQRKKSTRSGPEGVVGTFRATRHGYGFVRPIDPVSGKPAEDPKTGEPLEDIYIAGKHTLDAAGGDVVLVRLGKPRPHQPGPRGKIAEVIERETHRFVGTYFEAGGAAYVQVDGNVFSQPIYVGDPGAKNARTDDKVVFEMVRFPSAVHDGEGVITDVLGPAGKAGVDTQSIIHEFNLPGEFNDDAMQDAREQADRFDESIPPERTDFTAKTTVTIDPVDARDFDDAITLERLDNGHWLLGVHIADVSHFVRPKTALDREAYERATSVYLPDRVIPMLPEIISNSLASLQPRKVRYTKSVLIEFTPEGVRTHVEPHAAAIKSNRRLTYEEVDQFLSDPEPLRRKWGAKVHELLGNMHQLAMTLRRRRMEHGSLELDMPEVKVDLDKDGRVTGAHVVENTESHQIIEEFMLAANEAVADLLDRRDLHFLRRVHEPPAPRKLKQLTEFVHELGYKVNSLESRFALQALLDQVRDKPERHAVNYAVLRAMQRAVYAPHEEGHYALASQCYCHFTSPIRRYPDLTVHRLLDAIFTGAKPRNDFDELVVAGRHCSDREQRAESAERELTKLKLLHYLSDRIGEEMDAIVTGVEKFGLFVQGIALPAEGLIHIEALADDYYTFDRASHSLVGRRGGNAFRLGDRVRVTVARVDLEKRELDFRLTEQQPRRKDSGGKKALGGKQGGKKEAGRSRRSRG